ncbi:MAG: hypothetical protein HYS17_08395 [Micavibrio aeruginosavorus]|uniref:Uncharacterized protein n=1 Tax=Micavibrio aeruginosavorus TaxID=349221 RepID=A0A7T5UH22_9BACT|nr:MAG: hypothetical protein HYS17_08395 [Micavibrio aeruginosavorus]
MGMQRVKAVPGFAGRLSSIYKAAILGVAMTVPVTGASISQSYSQEDGTEVSRMMRRIEGRVNALNLRFPVVIMDDDSINLRPTRNDPTFRNRFQEVLLDRNIHLRWNIKSEILEALGGLKGPEGRNPAAIRVSPDHYANSANPLDAGIAQSFMCIVIPPVADVSSKKLMEDWLAKSGPTVMKVTHDPGPYALMLRATWHEVWHCLDKEFYREQYIVPGDKAIDNAMRMHMSEVFADVASTLTMAGMGYSEMARDMADIRTLSSYWNGPRSTFGSRPSDENYYEGAVYYIGRAQDLMHKHIQEAGIARVSAYSMEDIARIAGEVTRAAALDRDELKLLTDFYARGSSYSGLLKAEAEAGNQESRRRLAFLAGIQERVRIAKERLLIDQGQPVDHVRGEKSASHWDARDTLKHLATDEKGAIEVAVRERVNAARLRGQAPEQGVVGLIDDWRRDVHAAGAINKERERQLYVLSLMLSYGELDRALGRDAHPAGLRFAGPSQ